MTNLSSRASFLDMRDGVPFYDRMAFLKEQLVGANRLVKAIEGQMAQEQSRLMHELGVPRKVSLPILEPTFVPNPPAVETAYDPDGQDELYEMAESDHRDGGPLRAA